MCCLFYSFAFTWVVVILSVPFCMRNDANHVFVHRSLIPSPEYISAFQEMSKRLRGRGHLKKHTNIFCFRRFFLVFFYEYCTVFFRTPLVSELYTARVCVIFEQGCI